jgi:P-type Cu+ transporter
MAATLAFVWTPDRIAAVALGAALCGFLYFYFFGRRRAVAAQTRGTGGQEVTIVVSGGYRPDVVLARRGSPLTLVFDRREDSPCSDEVVIPEFEVRRRLPAFGKTAIEIRPEHVGEFPFSCGMNMLHGLIRVVD